MCVCVANSFRVVCTKLLFQPFKCIRGSINRRITQRTLPVLILFFSTYLPNVEIMRKRLVAELIEIIIFIMNIENGKVLSFFTSVVYISSQIFTVSFKIVFCNLFIFALVLFRQNEIEG